MQRFLLPLLLLCSTICFGQSRQSDSIYAIGVELYHQGKYEDAKMQFEKSNLLDHEELDSLSTRREYSSMWLASCQYKLGDEVAARKTNLSYKSQPIDRRNTIVADSLSEAAFKKIQNQRFFPALLDLNEVNRLEHQVCDKDNFFHVGTYQMKGQCFFAMQQADSALKCFEEVYRIVRIYYDDTDTLLLGTVDVLYSLNFYLQNTEEARLYNDQASAIIKANYTDSHPGHVTCALRNIELSLVMKEWDEAHNKLLDYIELLYTCLGDNHEAILRQLITVRNDFDICRRMADVTLIDEAIKDLSDQNSLGDQVFGMIIQYMGCIETGDDSKADQLEKDISRLLKKLPKDSFCVQHAAFILMKTGRLVMAKQLDKAQDLFKQLKKQSLEACISKGSSLYSFYTSIKSTICIYTDDFEGAIEALTETIESTNPEQLKQHPEYYSQLACCYVLAGQYKQALSITGKTIEEYDMIVQKGGFRIEKDTADIRKIIKFYDDEIKGSYWMPDSVRYVLRDIECQYIQLLSRLMTNEEFFQIDIDYLNCIFTLAEELVKIDKFLEAQAVIDNYILSLQQYYNKIDKSSEKEEDLIDRYLIVSNMADVIQFKRICYEKGDPNGAKAYLDYASFLQSTDPENLQAYEEAMAEYYRFTDNHQALSDYLIKQIEVQGISNTDIKVFRELIEELSAEQDDQKSQQYLKLYLSKLIDQQKEKGYQYYNISQTLDKICNNYINQQDTTGLLYFYQNELWPSFDPLGNEYLHFFFQSLYRLDGKVKNEEIVESIATETHRKASFFSDKEIQACVDQAIAGILIHGGHEKNGIAYIQDAIEKTQKDQALQIYFSYGLYDALYKDDYSYRNDYRTSEIDSLFFFGHEILKKASKNNKLLYTTEICELLERQMTILSYTSHPMEYIDDYQDLLKKFIDKETREIEHVYTLSKHYKRLEFIDDATIPKASSWKYPLIKALYKLCNIYPKEAGEYALNIVHDGYKSINTSLYVHSIQTYESDNLISMTSKYAYKYQTDSLKVYAYNSALLCKGLQLRSEYNIQALIKESGHMSALNKYHELQYTRDLMANCPESMIDSLQKRASVLEDNLYDLSKYFGDYKKTLFISWESVQQHLTDEDIAIEFTHVDLDYDDRVLDSNGKLDYDPNIQEGYYACIVKKGMSVPEIVFIASDKQMITTPDVYRDGTMTLVLTHSLSPYLNGVKNIYFSPIGEINRLAIESLPLVEDPSKTLSDKYNLYRLSSTRELVIRDLHFKGTDAAIYGGLEYDISIDEMKSDATKYPEVVLRDAPSLSDEEIESRRPINGIPYLYGTKIEAESIIKTINDCHDSTLVAYPFMGADGTEASFKALDGKQKRIIHIASHGFYDTKTSAAKGQKNINEEDRALLNSGLYFSGAENIFQGEILPSHVEDGVLSAMEIASIDLSGLDIVVLSACQTAQGHITGEGVFGLQRGFKKAGANSILMSLWKVDDAATCLLMTEFYKNWISAGMNKHDALESAKQTVRSHTEKGWDDPKYWAAFILLDAVE